ncbi:hypothetical protein L53_14610 [Hyphomonas sp. L-53-1-40]|uniref:hypothetical protein n=1 Tax=Hyphomonas sp. L-53-1-40 TaxID=1207058 RepID=UPI0004589FD7|nr:hypothetical protein [Hyphomonas sp. L-53-1-40]KCZ61582.1 hypothetical protein L53_14610 [Hyphomonas sp. L-53-1-40]
MGGWVRDVGFFAARSVMQALLVCGVWYLVFKPNLSSFFQTTITPLGHINGLLATGAMLWIVEDLFYSRSKVYARYGLLEPPLRHSMRFLRLIVLVASCIISLAIVLKMHLSLGPREESWRFWSSIGLVASASVAALGWLVTNFQNQTAHRIAETEGALRDMLLDPHVLLIRRQATLVNSYWTENRGFEKPIHPSLLEMNFLKMVATENSQLPVRDITDRIKFDRRSIEIIWEYLNIMERLAIGVRSGRLDFRYTYDAVVDIVRGTMTKWGKVIEDEVNAKGAHHRGKECNVPDDGKTNFENFIWLAYQFERAYCHKTKDKKFWQRERRILMLLNKQRF